MPAFLHVCFSHFRPSRTRSPTDCSLTGTSLKVSQLLTLSGDSQGQMECVLGRSGQSSHVNRAVAYSGIMNPGMSKAWCRVSTYARCHVAVIHAVSKSEASSPSNPNSIRFCPPLLFPPLVLKDLVHQPTNHTPTPTPTHVETPGHTHIHMDKATLEPKTQESLQHHAACDPVMRAQARERVSFFPADSRSSSSW